MRWPQVQQSAAREHQPTEFSAQLLAAALLAVTVALDVGMGPGALWLCAGMGAVTATGLMLRHRVDALVLQKRVRALTGMLWGLVPLFLLYDAAWTLAVSLNMTLLVVSMAMLCIRAGHPDAYASFVTPALGVYGASLLITQAVPTPALAAWDLTFAAVLPYLARRLAGVNVDSALLSSKVQELEQRLNWTTSAFNEQKQRSRREEQLARQIFDRLTRLKSGDAAEVVLWGQSTGSFSGDLPLYATSPQGHLSVLFCDFTGHGLPAALGAIPVSSIFYAMVAKGYTPVAIAEELNLKLAAMLPVDYFCCAGLLRLSPDRSRMELCNAGLPPMLIIDGKGERVQAFESDNLPLGISAGGAVSQVSVSLHEGDGVYVFSDGLIESENLLGEMFGMERLIEALRRPADEGGRLDSVRDSVLDYLGANEPVDDISLIELRPQRSAGAGVEPAASDKVTPLRSVRRR